ncbi:MAG: hypothetical protein QGG40_13295 [Myxococcota bacterium]|nr:hypothetical protein [Myxococcota bacterium]
MVVLSLLLSLSAHADPVDEAVAAEEPTAVQGPEAASEDAENESAATTQEQEPSAAPTTEAEAGAASEQEAEVENPRLSVDDLVEEPTEAQVRMAATEDEAGTEGASGEDAAEGEEESAEASEPTPAAAPGLDLSQAVTTSTLDKKEFKWLKPKRGRLPQNPYGQTDFTAYTLELGEVKIGVASITAGVLPGVQIGTVPALFALGVPNVNVKTNFFRAGPLDGGLYATRYQLSLPDIIEDERFTFAYSGLGAVLSLRLAPPWSIHAEGHYDIISLDGIPDPSIASGYMGTSEAQVNEYVELASANEISANATMSAARLKVATDVRFNRRDSLVLQAEALVWVGADAEVTLPPIAGLELAVSTNYDQSFEIQDTYVASIAWQFAWKQIEARIGWGAAAVPYAFLLQTTELSYRFGGATRRTEYRMRRGWRQNRRDLRKDTPPEMAPPAPPEGDGGDAGGEQGAGTDGIRA